MEHLCGFAALAARYDGFILDLWGVVHDGVNSFPHAVDCLGRMRALGKQTLLLSNAPRPSKSVRGLMRAMGIDDDLYGGLLTSGEAVRQALIDPPDLWWSRLGPQVFHLGPDRDRAILDGMPYKRVASPAEADFVLNTGPDDHRNPTELAEFEAVLRDCARNMLPMVCANPDLEVVRGGVRVLCAGALAVRYRELGGDVRSLGKPDPVIYRPALQILCLPAIRVLAVGDSLRTDIAGAAAAGMESCWVLGGLHSKSLTGAGTRFDKGLAEQLARSAGLAPVATIERFSW